MLQRLLSIASKNRRTLVVVILSFALLWAMANWVIFQGYSLTWTGFGDFTKPNSEFVRRKTLWDWMQLFIIPIFLSGGVFLLNRSERRNERDIAEDRQREAALQSYLDKMADLLLKEKLQSTDSEETRDVARIRTLTVLRGLDGKRKGLLLLFLYEAGLIIGRLKIHNNEKSALEATASQIPKSNYPVISLRGADLTKANLIEANLLGADLRGADLSEADLTRADLSEVDLSNAILTDAKLIDAKANKDEEIIYYEAHKVGAEIKDLINIELTGVNLTEAHLIGANLSRVHFHRAKLKGAKLSGANLTGADLLGADLSEADLTKANLRGANLRRVHLTEANLKGADLTRADMSGAVALPEMVEGPAYQDIQAQKEEPDDLSNERPISEVDLDLSFDERVTNLSKVRIQDLDIEEFSQIYEALRKGKLSDKQLKNAKSKIVSEAKSLKHAIMPDWSKHR